GAVEDLTDHVVRPGLDQLMQIMHQLGEITEPNCGFTFDGWDLIDLGGCREQAHLSRLGMSTQMLQRYLADAARRLINHPQERKVIARIQKEPQVGQHVSIFLAIEERQAPNNLVWDSVSEAGRFERPRQSVDANENREIPKLLFAIIHGLA